MKPRLNLKTPLLLFLIIIPFLMATGDSFAQVKKKEDLKDFKIIIERTENGVQMKSMEGAAWTDLSFNLNNYRPKAVNEHGMTSLRKDSSTKDTSLAHYKFTVAKTQNGIELRGIKGTAWSKLAFSLPENGKQAIDQNGMIQHE